MSLDHSKANVTISVAGIAISRTYKRDQFEIDFLRCDRHKLVLYIQEIELDPVTRRPVHSSPKPHSLRLDEDILIDVVYPDGDGILQFQRGVSTYTGDEFNRLEDLGDDEDFRWVADLEGPEFHNGQLRIKNLAELVPMVFISSGIVYTRRKTDEMFTRVSLNGKPSSLRLGKFAHGINTDITCPEGGAVILSNRSDNGSTEGSAHNSVSLLQSDLIKYLVTIENHCDSFEEYEGTDFRLFYDVLEDGKGRTFDLRRVVAEDPPGSGSISYVEDGYPQNCFTVKAG